MTSHAGDFEAHAAACRVAGRLTQEDRMSEPYQVTVDCWQCGGGGMLAGCFEDTCCCMGDPDDPDGCCSPRRCDICRGKGSYEVSSDSEAARDEAIYGPR